MSKIISFLISVYFNICMLYIISLSFCCHTVKEKRDEKGCDKYAFRIASYDLFYRSIYIYTSTVIMFLLIFDLSFFLLTLMNSE